MTFCHECGEQVAKEDVFCPYCGISLKPTVQAADDESLSETIVGVPSPVIDAGAISKPDRPVVKSEPEAFPDVPAPVLLREQLGNDSMTEPVSETRSETASTPDPDSSWVIDDEMSEADSDSSGEADVPAVSGELAAVVESPGGTVDVEPLVEPFIADVPEAVEIEAGPEGVSEVPPSISIDDDLPESAPVMPEPEPEPPTAEPVFPVVEATGDAPPVDDDLPEPTVPAELVSVENVEIPMSEEIVGSAIPETVGDSLPEYEGELIIASEPGSVDAEPEIPAAVELSHGSADPDAIEPVAEADASKAADDAELPIAMPDIPRLLENEPVSKFDSVQRISDEAESLAHAADAPAPDPAAPDAPSDDSGAGRPYTSPNMSKSDTDGRRAAKLKPLDEGTILNGRYEIVRKIGGGGMGAVYLANDRNLGGVLRAVKEMVQSYIEAEQQDKAVADFKRESLLLTSLDHQAIPTIYDYFFDEKEGRFYLVMKYISGGDLAGRLRAAPEGKIDEKSVAEWAIQIADVLHYLHTHEPPIVYRDLKPANVMIDGNSGRVMLIDFGIARWVNKEEKGVTAVGTMGYAPPELFSGNVEARSDIYSLGSTMFHLLTGADPQSNPLLIFDFQKNPRPRQINSRLSDQIEQIIMRAVEYNADMRFSSAGEMRDTLREHLRNLDVGQVTYGVKAAPSNRAFSEQMVFCGYCGKQIVATDVFCAFCGAQQPIAQQSISQPAIYAQPMTAKLTVVETGELEPSVFKIEKPENLLGRRDPMSNIFPEVDLSKFDPQTKISRRHARVWLEGAGYLVEDLGSSNGTTLIPSGSDSIRLLPHQPRPLSSGDRIRLGDTTLHFTIG